MSRFSFFPDSLLDHADAVKINLRKVGGRVCVSFTVEGDVGPKLFGDDDEDGGTVEQQMDAILFARSLLVQFACSSKGGAQ